MIDYDNDPIFRALKRARAAGVVGTRFEVVGKYDKGERKPGIHSDIRTLCEQFGMRVKSSSSGSCCLPCSGRGYVDDTLAQGCVRSSMRCPTCLGRGDFAVVDVENQPMPVDTRPDGWPLCPDCGEDELACLATPEPPEYEWPLARYLEHELFCYRCGKVTWKP